MAAGRSSDAQQGFRTDQSSFERRLAYSQTIRTRFPGWLTFLQVSGFAGSDDTGELLDDLVIRLLGVTGGVVLRVATPFGTSGASGKTSVHTCGCSACACGGRSQTRRTSSGLGMMTVPS
jgi:hypothetical protein